MNLHRVVLRCSLLSIPLVVLHAHFAAAQVRPRVTEVVNDARRITLQGNVHPLARPEFDRGAVADSQPMNRILLLLKRSDEQETALQTMLQNQQDKSSPSYHQWLTPEQFGEQFGPADADIQAVTDWLSAQGFSVGKVYSGKTVIEFSGSAGQVQRAFGTAIHSYAVSGKMYSANASDPQIPAALAPVVSGVVSLNNFPREFYARRAGEARRRQGAPGIEPLFTFPFPGSGGSQDFYALGPADFATIYNSANLIKSGNDGAGQTIAIVGETNINVADVKSFRGMFGLLANFDSPNVILNGEDPGITSTDEEGEADLDTQWSGAVAPGATVKFVVSASTPASAGIDLSALYIIERNLAGVMSESYGACEQALGTAGNAFYNALWEQAAAQGITVILSAGDGGSAGCDNFNVQAPATQGLAVSGLASTPYNVSVGGTDFDEVNIWSTYWSATNDPVTGLSATRYIPEIPWNENCAQRGLTGCGSSAPQGSVNIVGGSGGKSTVYSKPVWQMGISGMPTDNHRAQPDISLFASPGFDGSGYIICQADQMGSASCSLNAQSLNFLIIGGTSASAPAFAGVMALVNQYQAAHGGTARQGNANFVLYPLSKKTGASCTSSATEAATCIYNDVTHGNSALTGGVGTNSVPCQGGTLNCSVATSGSTGVLVDPSKTSTEAWTVGTGYDLATGLGTVNVGNLAANWGSVSTVPTTTTLTLSPTTGITHGSLENVSVKISVKTNGSGTPGGDVALLATLPNNSTVAVDQFTLDSSGNVNATTNGLPGGASSVTAHYTGDGTNAPSDSTAVAMSVNQEISKTFVIVPTFDASGNPISGNASTFPYGTSFIIRAYVTDKNGAANPGGAPSSTCLQENALTCPTGTITLTDNGNALGQGIFQLNNGGYTRDLSETAATVTGGTHNLQASYSGDNSFTGSVGSTQITVTPAPTTTQDYLTEFYAVVGQPLAIGFITNANVPNGVGPTGTFLFNDGGTSIGTVTGTYSGGQALLGGLLATFTTVGKHNVTATYSGDANYASSTSSPTAFFAQYMDSIAVSANPSTVTYGNPITITAKVTTPHLSPALAGQVNFNIVGGTQTTSLTTDGSGNQILTSSVTFTPQFSATVDAGYGNDLNYVNLDAYISYTVNIPDFSLAPTNGLSVVPVAGQPGNAQITITPASQTPSTVTLRLAGIPNIAGYTISLAPQQVNLNGAAVQATLSLTPNSGSSGTAVRAQVRKAGFLFLDNRSSWTLSLFLGVALLLALSSSSRRRKLRSAFGLSLICLLCFNLGCGGGGSSGGGGGGGRGGGGGGGTPNTTSVTLTTSNSKVSQTGQLTLTATVTGGKNLSGSITFYDYGNPLAGGFPVTDANPSIQIGTDYLSFVGVHQITAKYSGDAKNLSSTSTAVTQAITGTTSVTIQGSTGSDVHAIQVTLGLQ